MPFCIECGARIPDGARLCQNCDPAAGQDICQNCGQPYASPGVKFCMKCGTPRPAAPPPPTTAPVQPGPPPISSPVQPGPPPMSAQVQPGPPPVPPGVRICPSCGREASNREAAFCIWCAAKLPSPQAAPGPPVQSRPPAAPQVPPTGQTRPAAPTPPPPPLPLTPEMKQTVHEAEELRLGVYQNIGRRLLTACRQGEITKDRLPPELTGEIDKAFATLKSGQTRLIEAGVCPQCKDIALQSGNGFCSKCGQSFNQAKGETK